MKTETVHVLFALAGLLFAAALQDVLPPVAGVKPPFVAAFVLCTALRATWPGALLTAFVGGYLVDALGGLPFACTAGYLAAAAALARPAAQRSGFGVRTAGVVAVILAAPLLETWLTLWGLDAARPPLTVRFLSAAALALPTAVAVFGVCPFLARHAGVTYDDGEDDA